jgi:ribulose-phosphate 3-epimerase
LPGTGAGRSRRPIKLAPSILSADFARLGQQIAEAEAAGADILHVDVMDGHFVPNITIGPLVVQAVRRSTSLPVHVHLMIERPETHIEQFAAAGADLLTVHVEATPHLHRVVEHVRCMGKGVGVSLNPATPVWMLDEIISGIDLVLVMTVDPGFGGQAFITSMLDKIARVRAMVERLGLDCAVEVDGGINQETVGPVVAAGANVLVAGAAIFDAPEGIAEALRSLRHRAGVGNE